MALKDDLLKLKQEINSVGMNVALKDLSNDFVDKIESEKDQDNQFCAIYSELKPLIQKALENFEDYESIIEIKNKYYEAFIYSKLKSLLQIKKINESKTEKKPDFSVTFRGREYFVELKSLNMLDGKLKHRTIMENSFNGKIELENQISSGKRVASNIVLIQPYHVPGKEYDPSSPRMVIHFLIDKICQNIKKDQFSQGETILLVDLSGQLPLLNSPENSIYKTYKDYELKNEISGELWHVALGKIGDNLHRPIKFEGQSSEDGRLIKNGVLVEFPFIKGIIFHINNSLYSIVELKEKNSDLVDLLEYASEKCNVVVCKSS
ncbi:MAG: hypothetical protein RBR16_07625 [Syntrophus sp. (in: bacteria)]|nr:hypothetical protein [Syntrophus sp. (in: bacteria)]